MSLINDVLKDLDDRRAGGESIQQSHVGGTIAPVREKSFQINWHRLLLLLIVLVGVLALAAFLHQLYGNYQQRLTTAEAQNQEAMVLLHPGAKAQITPATTTQVALSQAQISAVFVTQLDQGARIEVQLTQKVEHQVSAPSQTELMIKLPNTELTTLLPSVAEHPLVDSLDVASEQRGLTLNVTLAKAVNFQTYLLARGQYYALVLDLFAVPEMVNLPSSVVSTESPSKASAKVSTSSEPAATEREDNVPPKAQGLADESGFYSEVAPVQTSGKTQPFSKTTSMPSLAERDRRVSQNALNRMRSGQAQMAVTELQQFIMENPTAQQARETLAVWALSQAKLELAESVLSEGMQISPQHGAYIKLQARLLSARAQQAEALALLNRNLAQNNQDQEYLALLASLFQQQGQHARAIEVYQVLLKKDEEQAQWWVGSAISLEALELKQDALRAYVQARRIPGIDARLKMYAESRIQALN